MKWEKLRSKRILSHPRIEVYEDTVRLPNGHETDYIRFGDARNACTLIAINDEGKVLVQKEYSYLVGKPVYQFPGGMIDDHETIEEGALRELAEETQLSGDLEQLYWYYFYHRRSLTKDYVFVVTNLAETQAEADIEEDFENFWMSGPEIDELVRNDQIRTDSILTCWGIYKIKKGMY